MDKLLPILVLLAEPLGLLWLGLIGLTVAAGWRRSRWLAAGGGMLALLLMVTAGSPLPERLLRRLEQPWAGFDYRQAPVVDAVVLLGGGIEASRQEVGGVHLNRAGDRVGMALELVREGKAPVLVLGGGASAPGGDGRSESELVRDWIAEGKRAGGAEVLALGPCVNTHDEAERVRVLARARGWRTVLLVTSAAHMERARATFTTAGLAVQPAPCNFLSGAGLGYGERRGWVSIPSWNGLEKISIWLHEEIGWWEYRRRGWIAGSP